MIYILAGILVFFIFVLIFSKRVRQFFVRKKMLILGVFFIFMLFVISLLVKVDYFRADSCLDSGGSWNNVEKNCER